MIQHAIPKHNFFAIIQPASGKYYTEIMAENKDKTFELKDPRTGEIHKGRFHDLWKLDLDQEFAKMRAFCLLCFGHEPNVLIKNLKHKFPELQTYGSKCEIWLMERI